MRGVLALSAIGYRLSAIGYRLSAIGYRLSAIGYRLSAIGYFLSAATTHADFPSLIHSTAPSIRSWYSFALPIARCV